MERAPGLDYWRIDTGATPAHGIVGGLTYRPIAGTRSWVHYVHVASLDDAITEAERLGAVVLRPQTAVPKAAWYAILADPEGNIFAIYQKDDLAAFPPPHPEWASEVFPRMGRNTVRQRRGRPTTTCISPTTRCYRRIKPR